MSRTSVGTPINPREVHPVSKGTTLRNIRIDDDLWQRLAAAATDRGTDRSEVIRAAIEQALASKSFKAANQ